MKLDRRDVLGGMAAVAAAGLAAGSEPAAAQDRPRGRVKKIGTEEACSIPEAAERLGQLARSTWDNLDIKLVNTIYNAPALSVMSVSVSSWRIGRRKAGQTAARPGGVKTTLHCPVPELGKYSPSSSPRPA